MAFKTSNHHSILCKKEPGGRRCCGFNRKPLFVTYLRRYAVRSKGSWWEVKRGQDRSFTPNFLTHHTLSFSNAQKPQIRLKHHRIADSKHETLKSLTLTTNYGNDDDDEFVNVRVGELWSHEHGSLKYYPETISSKHSMYIIVNILSPILGNFAKIFDV